MPPRSAPAAAGLYTRRAPALPALTDVALMPPVQGRPRWSSTETSCERHAFLREYGPCPGRRSSAHKGYNILGVVDVESDPRQTHHVGSDAAGFGRPQMRVEAVLAKAQRHPIGRRAGNRVRAARVMRRD